MKNEASRSLTDADPACGKTLFAGDSAYGHRQVVEHNGMRRLLFGRGDSAEEETALLLADPDISVFEYPRLMLPALLLQPETKRLLVVGLGGGFMPALINRHRPDIRVTVVELDPLVAALARDYFGYAETPDAPDSLVIQDARAFLEACPHTFDQIWLDAFDGNSIPPHLATHEFLALCATRLRKGGVFVQNLHVAHPHYFAYLATATEVFSSFYLLRGTCNENEALMAIKGVAQPEPPAKAFARGLKRYGPWLGGVHLKAEAAKAVLTAYKDTRAVLYDGSPSTKGA